MVGVSSDRATNSRSQRAGESQPSDRGWPVMRKAFSVTVCILPCLIVGAFLFGCGEMVETGELRKETKSVELGGAERVRAEIELGVGTLRAGGGARNLLDADFVYNVPAWEPEVRYVVADGVGRLSVKQTAGVGSRLGKGVRCEWDIRLKDDVPMELAIQLGAGESRLDLGSLNLEDLMITIGAGEVEVGLTGRPRVGSLEVKTGAGDTTIDLTGDWKESLDAKIVGGVGRTTVRLPDNVGVRVHADKGIGKVSASGLMREDDSYVNRAYGDSGITLEISVKSGIGAIVLEAGI
jgi:hypothetical protein